MARANLLSLLVAEERASAQAYMEVLCTLGYRQAAIARHLGIARTQVCLWAHGQRRIPPPYMPMLERLIDQRLQSDLSLAQVKAVAALYTQINRYGEQMEEKLQAYHDRGVVLRELWSIAHATD